MPVYVKDYQAFNDDPDAYIDDLSTQQLINLRDIAAHLYYNVGDSGIEDNSFDAIEYHLRKRLKKEHVKQEAIGSIPIEKLRIQLPYPMASLNKVRPDQRVYTEFVKNAPARGIIWSDKLDGVSAMVVYNDGKPTNLYTRGNGEIGGNVSYLIEHMKFPEIDDMQGLFVVRGELVIKRSTFREKYRDIYSTARSFIVSQTNKGFITPAIGDVTFVAYEVVSYGANETDINPGKDFGTLELHGFEVVQHGNFEKDTKIIDITLTYRERREESVYDIDGLVLDYNFSRRVRTLADNPEYKVAFKMQFAEQLRSTVVQNVDWDISRHGRYNPVAEYKPVYIDHVRIRRATAHNAAHIRDWNMGIGTRIKVTRSGDVIPQIKDVTVNSDIDPIFPSDKYEWHWKGRDIILNKIDSNPRVQQKRILHFVTVIEVAGVGEKTVEKLYEAGFDDIQKILDASVKDLTKVRGIGKLTAQRMKERLDQAMRTTPVDRFLAALTVTNFRVSRNLVKEVLRTFPTILDVPRSTEEIIKMLKKKKIKGIGPKRFKQISEQFPKFRQLLMNLDSDGVTHAIQHQKDMAEELKLKGYNPQVEGQTFVFSGFKKTPYNLEDYIFNNMGQFSSTVTSGTTAVIAYTNTLVTPKILAARGFGVPIYTVQEFKEQIIGHTTTAAPQTSPRFAEEKAATTN